MTNVLHQISRTAIIKLALFAIVFVVMCPDFTIPSSDYDVYQFYQYKSLCIRTAIGFIVLVVLSFFVEKQQILTVIVYVIALSGTMEATLSLLQLMGVAQSHHAVFRLTGTFYNPGPLGGYLAACDAVTIAYFIKHQLYKSDAKPISKCFLGTAILLISVVLPATFSRTAWIALIAALIYIALICDDVRNFINKNKRKVLIICLMAFVLIVSVFVKKSVSASGRFLVWKISAIAIAEKPLTGHSNFDVAYRDASEKYFSQKNWSESEFWAADYVDNSFNEYLFIAIKYGIPTALLLVVLLVTAFLIANKQNRHDFAAGIISIAVFAIASYPLHISDFVVLSFFCVTASVIPEEKKFAVPVISVFVVIGSAFGIRHFNTEIKKIELLGKPDAYYRNEAYSIASYLYEELYQQLSDNKNYMYNLAYSYYMNGEYDNAKKYFIESIDICGNSNVFKFLGKICIFQNDYANAEKYLYRAINILPNRIEPYNLLIELYSNDNYRNDAKLNELKHFVATHKFKR